MTVISNYNKFIYWEIKIAIKTNIAEKKGCNREGYKKRKKKYRYIYTWGIKL